MLNLSSLTAAENLGRLMVAHIENTPVSFVYTDEDGVTSVRTVEINRFERCQSGNHVMSVWDRNRNAPRSFRLDRVQATFLPGDAPILAALV